MQVLQALKKDKKQLESTSIKHAALPKQKMGLALLKSGFSVYWGLIKCLFLPYQYDISRF